jgi:hypothetical protein
MIWQPQIKGGSMSTTQHQFVFDTQGNKTFALVPIDDYEALLEDLEDIKRFAETRLEERFSWESVKQELQASGRL